MAGRGKPRFRLAADVIAEIESLAPQYGGRDAVVRQGLGWVREGGVVARLEALVGELAEAVSGLRAAVAGLSELSSTVEDLKAVVRRLEYAAARLGGAPAAAPVLPVEADDADFMRQVLQAFEGLEGARLIGGGSGGEES